MNKNLTSQDVNNIMQKLESYLQNYKERWKNLNIQPSFFSFNQKFFSAATQFFLEVVDELILFVEHQIPSGTDKKAAVLAVVASLFDFIAAQTFPVWLKPFVPNIKNIFIGLIVSNLIEYIVNKYNSGYWKKATPDVQTNS